MQRFFKRLPHNLLILLVLSSCSLPGPDTTTASSTPLMPADVLFLNGNVLTMLEGAGPASAVAIRGDHIIAVGDASLASTVQAKQIIDLAGKTLLPGFNDTHIHISGDARHYIDLTSVTSIKQIQELVQARAQTLGKNQWITGYGWSEDELDEQRKPNRDDLDQAAPNNPVVLTRAGAHSAVASSNALALAGFDASSPDPDNGSLERERDGRLTGVIRERQDIVLALIDPASESELRKSLATNLQQLFALGITSITQAMSDEATFARWRQTYGERSAALPRASVQFTWPGKAKFTAFEGRSGEGDKHFRLGALKIFVDGGFTGPAAYTKQPYRGETTYRGKLALTEAELETILNTAHQAGWQLGIHAIGDAAIELVVDQLSELLTESPRDNHRHYLNHFTVMPSINTMQTMAANGIGISQQPNFTYTLEGRYRTYLDGQRLTKNNPLRTPRELGVFMALSSDILPIGPMTGIYAAVTRRGMSGKQYGPEEALSVIEALQGYTRDAAYLTFEEDLKGTLEPGKLADFVILDENPLTVPSTKLLDLKVAETWLGGRKVYSRL